MEETQLPLNNNNEEFKGIVPDYPMSHFSRISKIGFGGEGSVYRASSNLLGEVAIKIFHLSISVKEHREVDILLKLNHPQIVHIFGIILDECNISKRFGYAMEFMQLGSLHNVIHNVEVIYNLRQVYSWINQVCCGLEYLHEKNIIHRDVKPKNMLLHSIDVLKLADFGVAREIANKSITGGVGTVLYMAPELIQKRRYGQPADVYSFAISMWEMIHREEPYYALENICLFEIVPKVLKGLRPNIDSSVIDPELQEFLKNCWHQESLRRMTIPEIFTFVSRRLDAENEKYDLIKECPLPIESFMVPSRKDEHDTVKSQFSLKYDQWIQILILGGRKGATKSDEMLILCKKRAEWRTLPLKLPYGTVGGNSAYLNGEIYIFGGEELENKLYKLDNKKLEWTRLANMSEEKMCINNSSLVFDGCIWIIGGMNKDGTLDTVEKYIPERNEWIRMPSMREKRYDAAAAVLHGKIFVCGGFERENYFKSVEFFETGIWSFLADMPEPRWGHSMVSDGSRLIIVGGYDSKDYLNVVWSINPEEEHPTWTELQPMQEYRSGLTVGVLEGEIYAIGGVCTMKTVEIFNGQSWKFGTELPHGLYRMSSAVISYSFAETLRSFTVQQF